MSESMINARLTMLEHIADTSSEDFQHGQPVRRPKIPRYKSKQEAQDVETSRVLANVDLGEKPRGTQGTKTAVSTKVQFPDEEGNIQTYKSTSATQVATGKKKFLGFQLLEELAGKDYVINLSRQEQKDFASTGMIRGEFSRGDVIRWAKRLNPVTDDQGNIIRESKWPKGKSLAGFVKSMNKAYRDVGTDIVLRVSETGGVGFVFKGLTKGSSKEIQKGHIVPSISETGVYDEGGANFRRNLASQAARPSDLTDTGKQIGLDSQYANIPLSNRVPKDEGALRSVGLGGNVADAFGAYLMGDDDPDLKLWAQFGNQEDRVKGRAAFEMGTGPDGKDLAPEAVLAEEELNKHRADFQEGMDAKNIEPPKVKANRAFKVFRRLAKAAGSSPNPIANISGDIVGVVMDGVTFAQSPNDPSALIDLTLSGTQALASLGALGLSFVPIPGARAGAFLLIKAGDKVATMERLYNMGGREGMAMATGKIKPGQFMGLKKPGSEGSIKSALNMPTIKP